jgi:hypothetical protein
MMNKMVTGAMTALTLAGTALSAAPASARDWGGYRHHNDDVGYAVAGGLVGLALGAALSSHHDYYGGYGGYGYAPYGYGYGGAYRPYGYGYYQPGYATCVARRPMWDPYYGRYVTRPVRYAC